MDFEVVQAAPGNWCEAVCDALLVVVDEHTAPEALGQVLGGALKQALADGDFAFKAGRTLYLHHPGGVKAARVVFAAAASAAPKALRAAVLAGVGAVKGGGTRDLLVAAALGESVEAVTGILARATALTRLDLRTYQDVTTLCLALEQLRQAGNH